MNHMPRAKRAKPPGKTMMGDYFWWLRRVGTELSQEKFAELVGVNRLTIQGLESGRYKGNSANVLASIAESLNLTIERLQAYLKGEFGNPSEDAARVCLLEQPQEHRRTPDEMWNETLQQVKKTLDDQKASVHDYSILMRVTDEQFQSWLDGRSRPDALEVGKLIGFSHAFENPELYPTEHLKAQISGESRYLNRAKAVLLLLDGRS